MDDTNENMIPLSLQQSTYFIQGTSKNLVITEDITNQLLKLVVHPQHGFNKLKNLGIVWMKPTDMNYSKQVKRNIRLVHNKYG